MSQLKNIYITRTRILANKLGSIGRHSKLKIFVVGLMAIGLFAGIFYVPFQAFLFLESLGNFGLVIIDRLLFLLFMGLFIMLIFSNAIISYSSAFKARETAYFFTLAIEYPEIYFIKLIDSIILSSWTFLCFLIPILSAYAVVRDLGWIFYLSLLIFFIPFAIIAGAIGSLIIMLGIKFIPRQISRWFVWLLVFLFITACLALILTGKAVSNSDNQVMFLLTNFIPFFKATQCVFLPNFWISEGIFKIISADYQQSLFWWLLLVSNALFFSYITVLIAKFIYYDSWTNSGFKGRRKIYIAGKGAADKIFNLFKFIKPPIRAMIVKDIKVFSRDPLQWSQFTIFFGLLGIYFANIRNLGYQDVIPFWKNIISFLNLASTNLTLASLAVRFVFPQLSLEGKRFWILGLAPLEKKTLLMEKFWLNSLTALGISLPLIILSNYMLAVSSQVMILSAFMVSLMSFALISICIGLGTLFPNFKEDNPAAIVSGFGGTLALVLALVYITVNVSALAIPFHLLVTQQISQAYFDKLIIFSTLFILILAIGTVSGFLSAGCRALERLEL
jgi:ABC-2 type transport system permease protein